MPRLGRASLISFAAVFAVIGAAGAMLLLGSGGVEQTGWMLVFVAPLLAAGALLPLIVRSTARPTPQERDDLHAAATYLGLSIRDRLSSGERARIFECVEHLEKRLRGGADGVRRVVEDSERTSVVLFEHLHRVQREPGGILEAHRTVAYAPLDQPTPRIVISPSFSRDALGDDPSLTELKLDDPDFSKRWRIRTDDPDATRGMLNSGVADVLGEWSGHEVWEIGPDVIACLQNGRLDSARMEQMIRRPIHMLKALRRAQPGARRSPESATFGGAA